MLPKTDSLTYIHTHTQTHIHFSELSSSVNFRTMPPKTDSLTYTHTQTHKHFSKLCDIERRYRGDVRESVYGSIVLKFTEDDYTWFYQDKCDYIASLWIIASQFSKEYLGPMNHRYRTK